MASERDVTKLNLQRKFTRLTEYRVLVAALRLYIAAAMGEKDDDIFVAEKLLKRYKGRMDSTFQGAQSKEKK